MQMVLNTTLLKPQDGGSKAMHANALERLMDWRSLKEEGVNKKNYPSDKGYFLVNN